ncbi:ATPase [uncultured Bacteroides sp.]|uniref:ATPase n=1 Tax=uncultured Bacteroides sp. TaxID=162156 RepID=UPI00262A1893|nr:ATPase [uncultured Bacteroides sp.]
MILIADSGSTKTDWCYGSDIHQYKLIQTEGINPVHQSEETIRKIITNGLIPQLPVSGRCTAIYFYGAGCLPTKTTGMIHLLEEYFPYANVYVESDLLGAARALCKNQPGIACILGTGSNSCLFDGKRITHNISPLGYILGDEGSGAYLGKRFIGDCLKGQLPEVLKDGLLEELKMTPSDIIDRVYRQPQANKFLASITPYIYNHKDMKPVHDFLTDCFKEFFRRNVLLYPKRLPVSFVGSIAWNFKEEIMEVAHDYNLQMGLFIKSPIDELARYHYLND